MILAGTERAIQRPQAAQRQKEHDSGKKRRHTRKHITVIPRIRRVLVLSPARPGKIHDQRQLDEADLVGNIPNPVGVDRLTCKT